MQAGVGYSNTGKSFADGMSVAEQAVRNGKNSDPGVVFAFCAGRHDHDGFYEGIRSVVGDTVPIVGGSTIGILTNHDLSYDGFPSGAAILQGDDLQCRVAYQSGINRSERNAGKKLAGKLGPAEGYSTTLIFYDSIKKPADGIVPPVMNASSPLLEGIEEVRGNTNIFGAGLIGDYNFQPVRQFCGYSVEDQCVVGVVLTGGFSLHHRIMHGLTPLDGMYHTITKINGNIIYELDGKPIVRMIDEIYGHRNWRSQHPVQLLSIGVNHGKRYGISQESHHVNRLMTGALPDGSGVAMFEPDLDEGLEIQFMLRDTGEIIESAKKNSADILREIHTAGRKPIVGFYIDYAGRTALLSNTSTEESHEVQKAFNANGIPLFGFFSGVELAPMIGKIRGLDWTGVLLVFTEG